MCTIKIINVSYFGHLQGTIKDMSLERLLRDIYSAINCRRPYTHRSTQNETYGICIGMDCIIDGSNIRVYVIPLCVYDIVFVDFACPPIGRSHHVTCCLYIGIYMLPIGCVYTVHSNYTSLHSTCYVYIT